MVVFEAGAGGQGRGVAERSENGEGGTSVVSGTEVHKLARVNKLVGGGGLVEGEGPGRRTSLGSHGGGWGSYGWG